VTSEAAARDPFDGVIADLRQVARVLRERADKAEASVELLRDQATRAERAVAAIEGTLPPPKAKRGGSKPGRVYSEEGLAAMRAAAAKMRLARLGPGPTPAGEAAE
jgi:hypothetical protein